MSGIVDTLDHSIMTITPEQSLFLCLKATKSLAQIDGRAASLFGIEGIQSAYHRGIGVGQI